VFTLHNYSSVPISDNVVVLDVPDRVKIEFSAWKIKYKKEYSNDVESQQRL